MQKKKVKRINLNNDLELSSSNSKLMKQYFSQTKQKKSAGNSPLLTQIRANFDKIQAFSAEKLSLARKVYAYVDANVTKIG